MEKEYMAMVIADEKGVPVCFYDCSKMTISRATKLQSATGFNIVRYIRVSEEVV